LKRTAGNPGTYGYSVGRKYDPEDLLTPQYFWFFNAPYNFRDHNDRKKRDASGRITLPATQATSKVTIASIYPRSWTVISDRVRTLLEEHKFAGMEFGETVLKGKSSKSSPEPFWELKSPITLPKMVNSVFLEERGTHFINEPPYGFGEPHYRQSELKPLGHFDVAHRFESQSAHFKDQPLVISQAFYRCCLKNNIIIEVIPARIDSD
jgi:hypothetical protein